jgi:NAD(P)H-hydrate epimerase
VKRVGVDAVGVERIATALRRSGPGFLRRSYTGAEIEFCGGDAERLAGRWAAKEAVIKCFDGTGICFPRRRIEVLPGPSGAPQARLLGGDTQGAAVQVSITHHSGLAVASALLEMPGPEPGELLPAPAGMMLPARPAEGHKGTFGTVVVVAGSRGYTGAAYLAATAAARSGAGLVRLLVGESVYPILAVKCTEVMATPVEEVRPGALGGAALDTVRDHLVRAQSGVVGPGLGRDESTWRLVYDLVAQSEQPLVLDADALNALAADRRPLQHHAGTRVLTPHPGEMARLCGLSTAEVQADREGVARRLAAEVTAVVVLKGAHTVVAAPDGRFSVDPHEVPALATGGTGDVLAGLIGGLLAQGSDAFTAAVTGVYVHAATGRRLAGRLGEAGLLASDLLPELPVTMHLLRSAGRR